MDKNTPLPDPDQRRIYGRRLGRPLRAERQRALDTLLPTCGFSEEFVQSPEKKEPAHLFPTLPKKVICEIGFGDGDHLAAMMHRHSTYGYIGAEPFINGMSAFLKQVIDEQIDPRYVKVWMDDAIRLLSSFTDQSLDEIYILNPDPWPKVRHHKRRIINQKNLSLFSRLLKSGCPLIMATDVDDLAEWMATEASCHPDFLWTAKSQKDWKTMPKDWIETKYEKKGNRAGRQQTYLIFERR